MELSEQIRLAETGYLDRLEKFFKRIFVDTNLSSHGLEHHQRVWYYARELLGLKGSNDPEHDDSRFAEKLLFASYLHDAGMSVDPGARHGIHSRAICEEFLLENRLDAGKYTDLLKAIEEHDNKNYAAGPDPPVLLKYLSVADDLDAFGFIGIYRYLEIYLKRKVEYSDLGYLVLENVEGRFRNLISAFGNSSFTDAQLTRYEITRSFFTNYNKEVTAYNFGNSEPSGFCGVAEITGCSVYREMTFPELIRSAGSFGDNTIGWYFNQLVFELKSFSQVT